MDKLQAEHLFASILLRWKKGDFSDFEKTYSDDITAYVDDLVLDFEKLKKRQQSFLQNYEVLEIRVLDFIYEAPCLAVRLFAKIKKKESGICTEDEFCWLYEMKDRQISRYWAITSESIELSELEVS